MDISTAYIGLDLHSKTCTMSWRGPKGAVQETSTFDTCEQELTAQVKAIDAGTKLLALEESSLAYWTARTLSSVVDRVIVCDPRENPLVSRAVRKSDGADAKALARLLRLGELHEVYQPATDRRALYKQACNHYMDLRDQQRRYKQKIKARLTRWGLFNISGSSVYSKSGRQAYLEEISHDRIRTQVESLYRMLDRAHEEKARAREAFLELGRPFPEVQEFREIPGIGPIGAHTFDAIIQTPHRFATKQKLWRYSKLGIRQQTTGGEKITYEQLDQNGHGELKNLSHIAWAEACKEGKSNEVKTSYHRSLQRTNDEANARLNTQRKILATMWGLWKHQTPYDPDLFLG